MLLNERQQRFHKIIFQKKIYIKFFFEIIFVSNEIF